MNKFEKIKDIIKDKKEKYVEENKDLTIKQNKDKFKKILKSSHDAINYLLLFSPFLFIAWLSFFINMVNHSNDMLLVAVFLLSLLSTATSSMFLTILMFCLPGDFFNPAYIVHKLKSKKIKKKIIIKTLEADFMNVYIDSKTINELSNYLKKEDMLEFLSKNKSKPSYNALYNFCNKKEKDSKKALENTNSKILLNALVDDMYSKDRALN